MPRTLSVFDTQLLNLIQEAVPLCRRPFAALAERLGTGERIVIERLLALKEGPRPIIRQISAIFDTRALGYRSSLVAARIDPARIREAADVISAHPGVSHNYQRNHAYNLWYTIAVPPHSTLGLEKTVEILHERSGAMQTRLMPTLKLFKIGVKLNLSGDGDFTRRSAGPRFGEAERAAAMQHEITDADRRMIRVLQQDLPLVEQPYDDWAAEAGVSLDDLFTAAERYERQKRMRRFSAVLHHREAGFAANGMGVWNVPADRQESFGLTAAGFDAVSHCYLRPTYEDWPYNIFTMVHAPRKKDCDAVLEAISRETGVHDYTALYSTHEFKKTRVKYFMGDIEAWEVAVHG